MFQNPVLDIVIGLVFIYLLYSLLATIIQELIATKLAFRSKVLEKAIIRMLEDGMSTTGSKIKDRIKAYLSMFGRPNKLTGREVATWFYTHPLIKYLGEDNYYSKPAYLSAKNFSKVMIDLLSGSLSDNANDVQKVNDSILDGTVCHLPVNPNTDRNNPATTALRLNLQGNPPEDDERNITIDPAGRTPLNSDTKLFLQLLWRESGADLEKFRLRLEQWFDDTMERTTGWYKRYTRMILLIIGLGVAIFFNIDTIGIVRQLRKDPKLREQLVQSATMYVEKNRQLYEQQRAASGGAVTAQQQQMSAALQRRADSLMAAVDSLFKQDIKGVNNLMGLGWRDCDGWWFFDRTPKTEYNDSLPVCIIGWILTALAISLGSTFWFDLLSKIVRIRGVGTKVESQDTAATPATQAPAPVAINVNTNPSEEAVG